MFITKWHTFRLLNNKVSLQANKNSIQPLLRLSNIRTFNANNLAQEIRFIISFIKKNDRADVTTVCWHNFLCIHGQKTQNYYYPVKTAEKKNSLGRPENNSLLKKTALLY